MPSLSIVIVSWNTRDLLRSCLEPLAPETTPAWEILVVDNGSSDGSQEMVRSVFPSVRLIDNAENRGYAAANNQGIEASTGRYVLLLNSDTRASHEALRYLLDFMATHPGAGAASPRLVRVDGTAQPYAFGRDPTLGYLLRRGIVRALLHRPLHNWATDDPQEVDWISGACLLVRREAIESAGLLDERFFMYFEDNDWCLRMRQRGWHVWYVPGAEITHLGGESSRQNPAIAEAYDHSLRAFYAKHYGKAAGILLGLLLLAYRRQLRPDATADNAPHAKA